MTPKRLIYLYSDSTFTPWKENIFARTVVQFLQSTPEGYYPYITHFVGFTPEFAQFLRQFDIVFNVCYGFGDEGQHDVVRWLDNNGIRHTASNFTSQIVAKDKVQLPHFCQMVGVNTPDIVPLSQLNDYPSHRFIAKPRYGSLHQNMLVFEKDQIPYQDLLEKDEMIIQPYLAGREFTVGVIPNADASDYICLNPLEIRPDDAREVYIAGQNYGKTEKVIHHDLDETTCSQMQEMVLKVHRALGLKGMSRTDIRISHGKIYVLDINTMPNLDTNSFLPFIANSEGIELKEIFRRILLRFEKVYHNATVLDNQLVNS
jgi:D-alanine-D-alanine ligase